MLVRAVISVVIVAACVSIFATHASAQAAPTGGIALDKIEIGDIAPQRSWSQVWTSTSSPRSCERALPEHADTAAPLACGAGARHLSDPRDRSGGQPGWVLTSVVCDGQQIQW
jgi:hypothetical protein